MFDRQKGCFIIPPMILLTNNLPNANRKMRFNIYIILSSSMGVIPACVYRHLYLIRNLISCCCYTVFSIFANMVIVPDLVPVMFTYVSVMKSHIKWLLLKPHILKYVIIWQFYTSYIGAIYKIMYADVKSI